MRIDIATLESGQVVRSAFSEIVNSMTDDVRFDAPVTGDVEVSRDRTMIRLQGMVETSTPLMCGRCLMPFRLLVRAYLNEEFLMDAVGSERPDQRELKREDFIHPLGPELILDINEVVRQQVLLGLPMIPLCRPDCRGLCPQCGANWNETACSHQTTEVDPRLAPLLKLKDRLPEK